MRPGYEGPFQWNPGAWFGSQLGGSAWMLLAAPCLLPRSVAAALAVAGFFLVINAYGLALWSRRKHRRAYPSYQALIAALGLASLATFVVLDWVNALPLVDGRGFRYANFSRWYYAVLLIFPGLSAWFALLELTARSSNADPPENADRSDSRTADPGITRRPGRRR